MAISNDQSLIRIVPPTIAESQFAEGRILGRMVGEMLAVGKLEVESPTPRFKIGEYAWCEPDYRQILRWADGLKLDPLTVIEELAAGKNTSGINTEFSDGRIRSLSWVSRALHKGINVLRGVEGLKIERWGFSGAELRMLELSNYQLDELAISDAPNFGCFICENNEIKKLSLSHLPSLDYVSCGESRLAKLCLTDVPNIERLSCGRNELTALDLCNVNKLTHLACFENPITQLDLSSVPNLTELFCWGTLLTGLDLSLVPNLTNLSCWDTKISELDIRPVKNLAELYYFSQKVRLIQRPDQNF